MIRLYKERPILFSAPMVRAILDGSKTQTRRVIKPQPQLTEQRLRELDGWMEDLTLSQQVDAAWQHGFISKVCPYGEVGDQLWVRETWLRPGLEDVIYKADEWAEKLVADGNKKPHYPHLKWKPSIHMFRCDSRIQLEITDIRIELLNDCSETDAMAEGVKRWVIGDGWQEYGLTKAEQLTQGQPMPTALASYKTLWDSINGAGSWDKNPWVWVVEFKRINFTE